MNPTNSRHHLSSLPVRRDRGLQQGFTLLELMITISIAAILAVFANAIILKQSEEVLAQGSGTYLQQVAAASEQHALTNYEKLANGVDVPSTAVDLRPTVAELVAEGLLNGGFPSGPGAMPTRQGVRIDILRTSCPGASCQLLTLVCTTTPVTLGGVNVRYDLAQTMVDQQGGIGGQALQNAGGVIRGPVLNVANPLGNVPGTVCGSSNVNGSLFDQFVRVRDSRDPDLQGSLSVQGATTLAGPTSVNNNLSVAGEAKANSVSVNNCVNLGSDGRAGFNCLSKDDVPAGWPGGVRAADVVASRRLLTTAVPSTYTGSLTGGPQFSQMDIAASGEAQVVSTGRMVANRLVPIGTYRPGTGCAEQGAVSKSQTMTGLVVCLSSRWVPLATVDVPNASCPTNGQSALTSDGAQMLCWANRWTLLSAFLQRAIDGGSCPSPGTVGYADLGTGYPIAYLCRTNPANGGTRWNRFQDITTNLVFVNSFEVTHGSVVGKPSCSNPGSIVATPIAQLIPKTESTSDGGFARFVIDNGSAWTVQLMNGSGGALTASPAAAATVHVYCYFP